MDQIKRRMVLALSTVLCCGLAGCGAGVSLSNLNPITTGTGGTTPPKTQLAGRIMGGQQPISGSFIYLYTPSTNILRGGSLPLGPPVQSDANGFFDLTGKYICPGDVPVYLMAHLGDAGSGFNGSIEEMVVLPSCYTLRDNAATTFIVVNEVTTAAAAYALAPFMTDAQHVGAPSNLQTGLLNAMQMAKTLANYSTGTAPGPGLSANATVSIATIHTIADIIAACVNSDGQYLTPGTPCNTLFQDTTIPGLGYSPSDTSSAAVNMVTHPTVNVSDLYSLVPPSAPFQPTLPTAPSDWTLSVKYTGGGLKTPYGIALDAEGSAWVTNESGNSVTKIGIGTTLLSGASGFTGSGNILGAKGIAFDNTGNAWVASTAGNSVVKLNSDGSFAGNYTNGIDGPTSIAVNSSGNVWVTNFTGNSVTVLDNTGSVINSSPLTASNVVNLPSSVAVDSSGNTWVANTGTQTLLKFASSGTLLSGAGNGYNDGNLVEPVSMDFDSSGNVWLAENALNNVNSISSTGATVSSTLINGLAAPRGLAVDGADVVWSTNSTASGSLSQFVPGGLLATFYGSLKAPIGVAVDGSGNVWTTNSADNSVTEFIGIASPVTTPLVTRSGP